MPKYPLYDYLFKGMQSSVLTILLHLFTAIWV